MNKQPDFFSLTKAKIPTGVPVYHEFPPNIEEIRIALKFDQTGWDPINSVFTYGRAIYVPSGRDLPEDVLVHELVHVRQQEKMGQTKWWVKYLADPEFRLDQELEAYSQQALYWRHFAGEKVFLQKIQRFAYDLASENYGNIVKFAQASAAILKRAKSKL